MEEYDLTKEDWDSVIEVGQFEGQRYAVASIPSKVKEAFARPCNKESQRTPYAIRAAAKEGGRGRAEDSKTIEEESYGLKESEQQVENKDEDDVGNSAMIMATKKLAKAGTSRRGRAGKAKEGTSTEAPTATGKGKEK